MMASFSSCSDQLTMSGFSDVWTIGIGKQYSSQVCSHLSPLCLSEDVGPGSSCSSACSPAWMNCRNVACEITVAFSCPAPICLQSPWTTYKTVICTLSKSSVTPYWGMGKWANLPTCWKCVIHWPQEETYMQRFQPSEFSPWGFPLLQIPFDPCILGC